MQRKTFVFAIRQTLPFLLSYLFIGIAFGMLMSQAGFPAYYSLLAALIVYAGSMQIVMVPLLTAGAPLYLLALTALLVNGRHVFYGLGFVERFRKMGWPRYPYMVMALTDEAYCALVALDCPRDMDRDDASFAILLVCHATWVISCFLGALCGQYLPFDAAGIDFAATAFFTVTVVDQWRKSASHVPAITGLVSAIAFYALLGPDRFLLPALAVSAVALCFVGAARSREEVKDDV